MLGFHGMRPAIACVCTGTTTHMWGTPLQAVGQDEDRTVFCEYHGHGVRSGAFMLRKGPWKLLYNMDAPHQLFHLEKDPHELHNVIEPEPRVFQLLAQELRRFCCPEAEDERAHSFVRRQLEALGKAP